MDEKLNCDTVLVYLDGACEALQSAHYHPCETLSNLLNAVQSTWPQRGIGKMKTLAHLLPNEQRAITEYVAQIRDRFPGRILAITLFGSKARGDSDAESDIDLLVLVDVEDNDLRDELWRIASDISLEYDLVLSARVFAQSRWTDTRQPHLPLYRAVTTEGIPLAFEKMPA